jgi:SpoVK/Ycf46/Vps4 family AAA+-type ATPase
MNLTIVCDVGDDQLVMPASEMIQELIRAHIDGNEARFRTVALQLAAREARSGHRLVAGRIRDVLDQSITHKPSVEAGLQPTPLARPSDDLRDVIAVDYPKDRVGDLVAGPALDDALARILLEHRSRQKLDDFGLQPRRRLLLHGPPGCGKTLTAGVIAGELGMPLLRVRIESLFSRYLGQTSSVLASIFDEMKRVRGLYLFDEFDALGRQRFSGNDVGEASRIVSTFLQLIDADKSDAIVVAASNGVQEIDHAVFRRFEDVVEVPLPTVDELVALLRLRTAGSRLQKQVLAHIADSLSGLSFAEAARVTTEARKAMVLDGRTRLRELDLTSAVAQVQARHRVA